MTKNDLNHQNSAYATNYMQELQNERSKSNDLQNRVTYLETLLQHYEQRFPQHIKEITEMNILHNKAMEEMAFGEIKRKEDVILHKDLKATRLINIIREKNTIISNLVRRYSIPQDEIQLFANSAAIKPCNNSVADSDMNWRIKY